MSSSDNNEWVVVPLDPHSFSDGDPAAWPKGPQFRRVNDELYRHKVAMMWLQKQGRLEKGRLDICKINFLMLMLSLLSLFISIIFFKKNHYFWHYTPYDISGLSRRLHRSKGPIMNLLLLHRLQNFFFKSLI